jgi:hypothetical protein
MWDNYADALPGWFWKSVTIPFQPCHVPENEFVIGLKVNVISTLPGRSTFIL